MSNNNEYMNENISIRILAFTDEHRGYELKGCSYAKNISEIFKTLDYMRRNDIPLTINTENIADTDGEEYDIDSLSFVFPTFDGEILPYIAVYVEDQ